MISGGGAASNTTVCCRCGEKLVYSEKRKTWIIEATNSMYCQNPDKLRLATIHRPAAGEAR